MQKRTKVTLANIKNTLKRNLWWDKRADRAWFSRLLRHPARKWRGFL